MTLDPPRTFFGELVVDFVTSLFAWCLVVRRVVWKRTRGHQTLDFCVLQEWKKLIQIALLALPPKMALGILYQPSPPSRNPLAGIPK
jgi:hypothetical protein